MSDQFVSEIRIFGFNFPPKGWAFCQGQVLPISQNTALFSLLGTNFGGDGKSTFALPNLQGNVPMGYGNGPGLSANVIGQTGGSAAVTLLATQLPAHTHTMPASAGVGTLPNPAAGEMLASLTPRSGMHAYNSATNATMSPVAVTGGGSGLPHNNLQSYVVMNYCIAMQGIFPARN